VRQSTRRAQPPHVLCQDVPQRAFVRLLPADIHRASPVVPENSIRRIRAMIQNQRIILRDAYVLQLLDPTIMWEMSVNNRRGPCGS